MQRKDEHIPPDLLDVATTLEQHRPHMTELEYNRVKRRAMVRGSCTTPATGPSKGNFMRSRFAILATLVTGLVLSSGGAALGVTALTSTESASTAQYGVSSGSGSGDGAGRAASGSDRTLGGSGTKVAQTESEGAARGGDGRGSQADSAVVQAPRQLTAASGDQLPFTGYASIPLMLIGLALLVAGLLLRRRANLPPAA